MRYCVSFGCYGWVMEPAGLLEQARASAGLTQEELARGGRPVWVPDRLPRLEAARALARPSS